MKYVQPNDQGLALPARSNSRAYRFYDTSVEVVAEDDRLLDALDWIFSRFTSEAGERADLNVDATVRTRHLVATVRRGANTAAFDGWSDASLVSRHPETGSVYRIKGGLGFYGALRQAYYTVLSFVLSNLEGFLQVHAGAVTKGGAGIVFPGGSGSGKTTLVFALTQAGYGFLSDEICLIRPADLSVRPFPRSIFLREDGIELFGELTAGRYRGDIYVMRERKCLVEIDQDSISSIDESLIVRYIIFPNYYPGAHLELREISSVEAMARLIASGSVLNMDHCGVDQGDVIDSVSSLVHSAACFELTSSRIDDAVAAVDRLVDSQPP